MGESVNADTGSNSKLNDTLEADFEIVEWIPTPEFRQIPPPLPICEPPNGKMRQIPRLQQLFDIVGNDGSRGLLWADIDPRLPNIPMGL